MQTLRFLAFTTLLAAAPLPEIRQELDLRVPMRDGVRLSTNVFRPVMPARLPALLVRTPYGKPNRLTPYYQGFVERGYALVLQDVRGRYGSEGVFGTLLQETNDGDDTLTWIARQPWSNGRVGMLGGSYLGIAQWKAALSRNPHLKAIFPVVSGCDEYHDRFYSNGGALKLGQRLVWLSENLRAPGIYKTDFKKFIWSTPLRVADRAATGRTIGFFQSALDHPSYDGYWRASSTCAQIEDIRIPVFITGGWYDNFVTSDLEAFRLLRAERRPVRAIIGPWAHSMTYDFPGFDFGPDAKLPLRRWQLAWFDEYVRDGEPPQHDKITGPPLMLFVMGVNLWREEQEWPLARAHHHKLYLSSAGKANSIAGDGTLRHRQPATRQGADQFLYDPKKPVPTTGGAICCNPDKLPPGPLDQRSVERRRDVLVYTTEPLKEPLEVTGPVKAVLWVSTSASDTDFTAKLVDVHPDGYARLLTDGILRLRYRDSLTKPEPARPGGVYRVSIDLGVTSNVFLRGHSIRLEISSSNFPRFDRNPNTGGPVSDEKNYRKATQTVYHDAARASHLILPVIPQQSTSVAAASVR